MILCRFCGEGIERAKGQDYISGFTHNHPASCRYRQDRVQALNGVHVGDLWINIHVRSVRRVTEIRLGGAGVYTDREPVYVMHEVWRVGEECHQAWQPPLFGEPEPPLPPLAVLEQLPARERQFTLGGETMWGLVEHSEPLTRPGEYPVPWHIHRDSWGFKLRSALDEWRTPGYRHPDHPERDEEEHAYWHATHTVTDCCIDGWECWQVDENGEPIYREQRGLVRPQRTEQLELVGAR